MEAAAALADEGGAGEELSLARLAERLGVRKPSLYNHVEGLSGLRRELALMALRELGPDGAPAAAERGATRARRP